MNSFETYVAYLALKAHFTQKNYDYIKYNGKIKANSKSFESRKDKYMFHRLSKMGDIETRIMSNLIEDPKLWIGDIISDKGQKRYTEYLKRNQSLTRNFTLDLKKMDSNFDSNLIVRDGQWPKVVRLYKTKEICIETLIILDDIFDLFPYWNKKIDDNIIWPIMYFKMTKYKLFLEIDAKKYKKIIKEQFSEYK